MTTKKQHVYVLMPTDVTRIRELLVMYLEAIDRIFDRSEAALGDEPDELMADLEFHHPAHGERGGSPGLCP